jgi:hypothetical protein
MRLPSDLEIEDVRVVIQGIRMVSHKQFHLGLKDDLEACWSFEGAIQVPAHRPPCLLFIYWSSPNFVVAASA